MLEGCRDLHLRSETLELRISLDVVVRESNDQMGLVIGEEPGIEGFRQVGLNKDECSGLDPLDRDRDVRFSQHHGLCPDKVVQFQQGAEPSGLKLL